MSQPYRAKLVQKENFPENQKYRPPPNQKYKYCGSSYPPQQCQAYGKMCGRYVKLNHFHMVCKSSVDRKGTVHEVEH